MQNQAAQSIFYYFLIYLFWFVAQMLLRDAMGEYCQQITSLLKLGLQHTAYAREMCVTAEKQSVCLLSSKVKKLLCIPPDRKINGFQL